jgi:DNA polymerase-3 subunit alpha
MSDSAASAQGVTFIHLRAHSAYSLSEGALPVKALARLAVAHDMPALAITDTNNLFGALEFSETLVAKGVQPIIGISLQVDMGNNPAEQTGRPVQLVRRPFLALLARNEAGYRNLMKLTSRAWLEHGESGAPHVEMDELATFGEGLICLTGGPSGPVNEAVADSQSKLAEARMAALADLFGDRLYVELQRHGLDDERRAEPELVRLAHAMKLPLVATNEPYFAVPDDFAAQDALLCIADGEVIAETDRRRLTPEHFFKSPRDMARLFADVPEAIEMTVEVARRCAFRPRPRAPILPAFTASGSPEDEAAELRREARDGLKERFERHPLSPGYSREDYEKRLEFELDVIIGMKFPGYFLIVADFIKHAKRQGIPVGPGRGSGAGSLVAWALTITDLDPLRFNLLFERFLNPERVSMPDFDIDFCQDRRDEVITYVQQKYGRQQVAQIITFGKLQARAVCRDVGRVLQMPYGQVDRLCKLIPANPANPVTLKQAIEGEPRLQEERDRDETVATMLAIGQKLEGLYRHASTHAAGVVIADRPLDELVPLYKDPRSSMPATQFNLKWVEPAGLVKFDFLGLKTLTVINEAAKFIRQRQSDFDIASIPFDDPGVYRMLGEGATVGIFQLESSGMRDALKRMHPDCIEDIIAMVALYRPGPMDNIPRFIACKRGDEAPDSLHPMIEPILKETYGIIVYQEQVMQIAQVLSGYSLGEADLLRRAMGKKIKAEMDQQKERFVSGAIANGVEADRAGYIFELVAKFAGYGFNKSHAAGYAIIAYQTAWLKANHAEAFIAASMTLDMGNSDKLQMFRSEAQRLGVKLAPPSINRSGVEFAVQDGVVQYSLAALKNVGKAAVEHIVALRARGGAFATQGDFARRIDPHHINRRALESLIKAGALDELNRNRAALVAGIDVILATASRATSDAAQGQSDMFGAGGEGGAEVALPTVEPWMTMDQLAAEFEAVGFYLSGHPLDDYMASLGRIGIDTFAAFHDKVLKKGATAARLAGTVVHRQERRSKSGNRFAFVGLSDPSGQYECICFSDTLAQHRDLLEPGKAVIVRVEADADGGEARLRLLGVEPLDKAAAGTASGLKVFLRDDSALESISARLSNGGQAPVRLVMQLDDREVDIAIGNHFTVSPRIKAAIKAIPGVVDVVDL